MRWRARKPDLFHVKLNLKTGEHVRIETDGDVTLMVYIERGMLHVTAQPEAQPTRVVIEDKRAKIERAGREES